MGDCSNPDFRLGNTAAELVDYTLELCNKNEDGTLRFPKRMYESYVTCIVNLSLDILKEIFATNAIRDDETLRKRRREIILGKCASMAKLVFLAYKRGWISDKQNTTWQKKINSVYFVVSRWK